MRTTLAVLLALGAAGSAIGAYAFAGDYPTQAERMLANRTPGPAQECIMRRNIAGQVVASESQILYRINRRLVYSSTIEPDCPFLTDDRTIVVSQNSTQLCEGDQFEVVDNRTDVQYGFCSFGPFVPYTLND